MSFGFFIEKGDSTVNAAPRPQNPRDWTSAEFKEHVRANGLDLFITETEEVMQGRQHLPGVLPRILRQQGLECQTYSLLNGMRAWQSALQLQMFAGSPEDVRRLRTAAGGGQETFSADPIAQLLKKNNILHAVNSLPTNPIAMAARMVNEAGFLVITRGPESGEGIGHAWTIIPNMTYMQDENGTVPPFIQLDSLSATPARGMGSDEFCETFYQYAGGGPGATPTNDKALHNQALLCTMAAPRS